MGRCTVLAAGVCYGQFPWIAAEEPVAEKGESKAEPVHDNLVAEKTKKINIYEFMGRNPNGTRKR